ncbi:hypothetical protein COE58_03180 [Bacillus cereus]|nr:hypothetical protein bcere0009_54920 [Bacillus cereus R309803]PFW55843.1 hypothetical protein COL13_18050 [Bacillus cereus]PGZ64981.1 hypothetical protein COE58_03180 [Bacillus cereus]
MSPHKKHRKPCSCNDTCCHICYTKGPTGATGPIGPGSTLFVTEQQGGTVDIPPPVRNLFIMDVHVTTTADNQRVKLDGSFTYTVASEFPAPEVSFGDFFFLFRDPDTLLSTVRQIGKYFTGGETFIGTWHPNFTFVDVPGPAGDYTYRVAVRRFIALEGISEINVTNLGLTATVYPPA